MSKKKSYLNKEIPCFRHVRKQPLASFTLVEIMIVVAIIAILAAIAIPNLLRARINSHDAAAKRELHTLVVAIESYAATSGAYPTNTSVLVGENPPYLNEDITLQIRKGYNITCNLTSYSYNCTAIPQTCLRTGSKNYTVTTGSVWTTEDCVP